MRVYLVALLPVLLTGCELLNHNSTHLTLSAKQSQINSATFLIAGQSNGVSGAQETVPVASVTGQVTSCYTGVLPCAIPTVSNPSPYSIAFIKMADMISQVFNIPVTLVNVSHGNTSSRDWVQQGLYQNILAELRQREFTAVLWVQGESDSNQYIGTEETYQNMKLIIQKSRDIQPNLLWYVALDGFQAPNAHTAQQRLIDEGIALKGPDLDAMRASNPEWFETGLFNGTGGAELVGEAGLTGHAKAWFNSLNADKRWLYSK